MYILERVNKNSTLVQIKKDIYDPERKRGVPTQIASQKGAYDHITDEVREKLTDDEAREFQEWLDARVAARRQERERWRLAGLKTKMRGAAIALNNGFRLEDEDVNENPDDVFAAMDELKKALRKAGYKRPQKAAKASQPKDDRQAELIDGNTSEGL